MQDLVCFGGNVKALGDGRVAGYLIQFSDETQPDLSSQKDFFTRNTWFDINDGERKSIYWSHGLDATIGVKRIGTATIKTDDVGVWLEGVIEQRDKYEKHIADLAAKGKLGWSSGAPSHLVTRKSVGDAHEILSWPIAEASLTVCPADYRNTVQSVKSLTMLDAVAEDHTKALPAGMSYDDLRSLLQDELNEDFPATDPDGDATPYGGLWIMDVYDDALVYRDDDDLYRIPYTVTSGNDVTWGDAECVIRTTVYQSVVGEDAENSAVPISGLAGKQADVTALKGLLRGSMTLDDHADVVRDAMSGFVARAEALGALSVKAGKPMSAARHAKLKQAYVGLQTHHTAMESHLQAINDMLLSTDPDAKKSMDELEALRTEFIRLQSAQLHMTA